MTSIIILILASLTAFVFAEINKPYVGTPAIWQEAWMHVDLNNGIGPFWISAFEAKTFYMLDILVNYFIPFTAIFYVLQPGFTQVFKGNLFNRQRLAGYTNSQIIGASYLSVLAIYYLFLLLFTLFWLGAMSINCNFLLSIDYVLIIIAILFHAAIIGAIYVLLALWLNLAFKAANYANFLALALYHIHYVFFIIYNFIFGISFQSGLDIPQFYLFSNYVRNFFLNLNPFTLLNSVSYHAPNIYLNEKNQLDYSVFNYSAIDFTPLKNNIMNWWLGQAILVVFLLGLIYLMLRMYKQKDLDDLAKTN